MSQNPTNRTRVLLTGMVFAAIGTTLVHSAAEGCGEPPFDPPAVWIRILPESAPLPSICSCDLNNNGIIDSVDIDLMDPLFMTQCPPGTTGCPGDCNNDGVVDFADVQEMFINLGVICQGGTAWIIIHDYMTFGVGQGQFCSCALRPLGPIIEVQSVEFIDASTGQPVPGFDFVPNAAVGATFDTVAGTADFSGFIATISAAIPAGLNIDLHFKVGIPAGTTFTDLEQALMGPPAAGGSAGTAVVPPLIGTSEVLSDGSVTGTHTSVQVAGLVQEVVVPLCAGDADGDGTVMFADITSVLGNWLTDGSNGGDANADGIVNFADITAVLGNWLVVCP